MPEVEHRSSICAAVITSYCTGQVSSSKRMACSASAASNLSSSGSVQSAPVPIGCAARGIAGRASEGIGTLGLLISRGHGASAGPSCCSFLRREASHGLSDFGEKEDLSRRLMAPPWRCAPSPRGGIRPWGGPAVSCVFLLREQLPEDGPDVAARMHMPHLESVVFDGLVVLPEIGRPIEPAVVSGNVDVREVAHARQQFGFDELRAHAAVFGAA